MKSRRSFLAMLGLGVAAAPMAALSTPPDHDRLLAKAFQEQLDAGMFASFPSGHISPDVRGRAHIGGPSITEIEDGSVRIDF